MEVRMKRRFALSLSALAFLLACSDDGEGPGSSTPPAPDAVPRLMSSWHGPTYAYDIAVSPLGHVLVIATPGLDQDKPGIYEYSAGGRPLDVWNPVSSSGAALTPVYLEVSANKTYVVSFEPEPSSIVVFGPAKVEVNEWTEVYDSTQSIGAGGVDQIAVSPSGDVYRLEFFDEAVIKYNAGGVFQREWSTHGSTVKLYNMPGGIAATNDVVYVSDTMNDRIVMFSPTGEKLGEFGTTGSGPGQFSIPNGLAIQDHVLYVAERGNRRIQKLTLDGQYLAMFPPKGVFHDPLLIAVQGPNVYVLDFNSTTLVQDIVRFRYDD
jgi:hypothetical protein